MTVQHLSRSRLRLLRLTAWVTVFAILSMLTVLPIQAATITVDTLADEDIADAVCSLREAIIAANNNFAYNGCSTGSGADVITFGVSGTILLGDTLPSLRSELTIDGAGSVTVSGADTFVLFTTPGSIANVTLARLSLTDGGFDNSGGRIRIVDSILSGNESTITDGGLTNAGVLEIVGSTISNNTRTIENYDDLTLNGSTIRDNATEAIFNFDGEINLIDSTISGNSGGIRQLSGFLTIDNSSIIGNTSLGSGGGLKISSGTVRLTNSSIIGNTSPSGGGGIHNSQNTFVTITNSTISGNTALTEGGGILSIEAGLTLTNTTITGNSAGTGGGISYLDEANSIFDRGFLSLVGSTISGNSASNGGGIHNSDGSVTLDNSTVSGNTATINGGGIFNVNSVLGFDPANSSTTLTNSTVFGNTASDGGGIYNIGGSVTLSNSTASDNTTTINGGSIYNSGGVVNLHNAILANSMGSGSNCLNSGGTVNSSGGNLIEDGSCAVAGALIGDPLLGAFTGSYLPLQSGSRAIDAGDNGCPPMDQRGATRPTDGDSDGIATCDLGSFEADGIVLSTSTATSTFTVPPPTETPTMTSTPSETSIFTSTPTQTPTPVVILPTATVPPPPPTPLCEDHNFAPGGVVRASTRDGLDYAINCRVLYQNGQPTQWLGGNLYNAGSIGIEGIFDLGVLQAVDIFSPVGRTYFEGGAVFCLRGQGTLIWLAASGVPRHAEIIGSYDVDDFPGFTCATLFEPSTLVLVRENPTQ